MFKLFLKDENRFVKDAVLLLQLFDLVVGSTFACLSLKALKLLPLFVERVLDSLNVL